MVTDSSADFIFIDTNKKDAITRSLDITIFTAEVLPPFLHFQSLFHLSLPLLLVKSLTPLTTENLNLLGILTHLVEPPILIFPPPPFAQVFLSSLSDDC